MTNTVIQPTFASGELDPALHSRVDLQRYQSGLKTAKNIIVNRQGGVSNRPGTQYFGSVRYSAKKTRLIAYEYDRSSVYIIELGDLYARFWKDGVLQGSTVVTPFLEAELFDIDFEQSADVVFLVHKAHKPVKIYRDSGGTWYCTTYTTEEGPYLLYNANEANTVSTVDSSGVFHLTANNARWVSSQVGSMFSTTHSVSGGNVVASPSGTYTSSALRGYSWHVMTTGNWSGTLYIEKSSDNVTWTEINHYTSNNDINTSSIGTEDLLTYIRFRTTSFNMAGGSVKMYIDNYTHINHCTITAFNSTTDVTVTCPRFLSGFTTSLWKEGAWSDLRGWPESIAFYQDRLCFGGNAYSPQTIWMSKTSNYVNFGVSSPLVDSDAISINLPSRKLNKIANMVSLDSLMAFTSSNEWAITGTGGQITPTTVDTKVQGHRGGSSVNAVIVGNRVVYIQPMGTILRDFGYDYTSNGFTGNDLSVFSAHLFKGRTITEMAYQQEPGSIIYALRDDGVLLAMTYMVEQQVMAWCWFDMGGVVESIAAIPGSTYNQIWMVVRRGSNRYIERLENRIDTSINSCWFLDCAIRYSGSATTTITGLSHLNGLTVNALADGVVVTGKTVSGGQITLTTPASNVLVGIPYESIVETLNIEFSSQTGTIQGKRVKVVEVIPRFVNSRGGYIGTDDSHLKSLIPYAHDTNGNEPITYETEVKLPSNYDRGGHIHIKQSDPLPMTLIAVIPKVQVSAQ